MSKMNCHAECRTKPISITEELCIMRRSCFLKSIIAIFSVEGGLVLQMAARTAPPPPTLTDPPPLRAPRSTSWACTPSPAAPTPSTAQWPPTRRRAPPSRDAWVKPAPPWPDTLHLVATETASPPALWLAETLKQQPRACLPALWWGAAQRRAATALLTSWGLLPVSGAPNRPPRPPSPSPHSCRRRGTCPAETRRGRRTRTWRPHQSAVAARQTCLALTRSQTSQSPYMVRCWKMTCYFSSQKVCVHCSNHFPCLFGPNRWLSGH